MARKVMVIAPHPDDAEIGMGGTIALLTSQGFEVVLVDLTNGEPTPYGSPEIRSKESAAASKLLGLSERITLDIKNREIFDTVENRKKVASEIRRVKPELLFIPYWEDGHPDHIQASMLGEAARFYGKLVKGDLPHEPHYPRKIFYFFSTHIRPKATPALIVDISAQIETKISAISAYKSQFVDHPANRGVIDLIRGEAAHWGFQVGVKFGEPFACREQVRILNGASLLDA